MSEILFIAGVALTVAIAATAWLLHQRNALAWTPDYVRGRLRRRLPRTGLVDVMFCFVDHFEPRWRRPDHDTEVRRVTRWVEDYPRVCSGHRDADGCAPKHTFFYPEEEYETGHLDRIAELCGAGFGEIEVHLHHDRDTNAGLRSKLKSFTRLLHEQHGALSRHPDGRLAWAFIHGNWALDNARPDGRWCGVNDELTVLAEEGCYADFTLPSAPDPCQTRWVNRIYYAQDDPQRPRSHERGVPVTVGTEPCGDLMIVQGPLGWDWGNRRAGLMPRLENADVRSAQPPTPARIDRWVRTAIGLEGLPQWVFVKIHTHGTQEGDMDTLLGPPVERMFAHLEERYNDRRRFRLHYVSAREMYNIIRAGQSGLCDNPGRYRDYVIPAPAMVAR
jgi:hypothetical protein